MTDFPKTSHKPEVYCSHPRATSISLFLSHHLHCSTVLQHTPISPVYKLPSSVCLWTLIIDAHNIFSCIPIDSLIETSLICSLLLDIFFLSCLFLFQTLTGCADFGSLLFFLNPLPDFLPSQIYKDFRENGVRHQMATKSFQLVIYNFLNYKSISKFTYGYCVICKRWCTRFPDEALFIIFYIWISFD